MYNTVSYSTISISNILKDTIYSGGPVTKDSKALKVPPNTSVTYRYSWNAEKDVLQCPSLRIAHDIYVETEEEQSTLYSTDLQILLKIHYYEENSVSDGIWQVINILPMLRGEQDYTNYIDIEARNLLIHEIFLTIKNNAEYDIFIPYVKIHRGLDATQTVLNTYGMAVTLQSIQTFDNGCKIFYDDSEGVPIILVFGEDENGNLAQITVNPNTESERVIKVLKHPGQNIVI